MPVYVHLKARGQNQVSSSITLHLIFYSYIHFISRVWVFDLPACHDHGSQMRELDLLKLE